MVTEFMGLLRLNQEQFDSIFGPDGDNVIRFPNQPQDKADKPQTDDKEKTDDDLPEKQSERLQQELD